MANIKFIKKQSGNVWITLSNGEIKQLPPNCSVYKTPTNEIQILDGIKQVFSCQFDQIESTQIEPAAAAAVTSVSAFMALMDSSFFFSVSGGTPITAEQLETTIENFISAFTGETLGFMSESFGDDVFEVNLDNADNLDGTTTAPRIGGWNYGVLGAASQFFVLKSKQASLVLKPNSAFKHTWDVAFIGGGVVYADNNVFQGVGYAALTNYGGDKTISDGFYVRPPYDEDAETGMKFCLAVLGIEEVVLSFNIDYLEYKFARITLEWDGVNDTAIATLNDGTNSVTLQIADVTATYPSLEPRFYNKVVWVETAPVITDVTPRAIVVDRHTEYIKSNY